MSELKPCPFCGEEAKLISYQIYGEDWFASIACKQCGSKAEPAVDKSECENAAIAAWNRRADAFVCEGEAFNRGYEKAKEDCIKLIESWEEASNLRNGKRFLVHKVPGSLVNEAFVEAIKNLPVLEDIR